MQLLSTFSFFSFFHPLFIFGQLYSKLSDRRLNYNIKVEITFPYTANALGMIFAVAIGSGYASLVIEGVTVASELTGVEYGSTLSCYVANLDKVINQNYGSAHVTRAYFVPFE